MNKFYRVPCGNERHKDFKTFKMTSHSVISKVRAYSSFFILDKRVQTLVSVLHLLLD